jgi:hypothetical protein
VGRLAIVIPSIASVDALEGTLLSVLENRPPRCEIVVVHTHPYSDPYQLQGEVRFLQVPARSSFVACANKGLQETSADVLHLLSAGCQVKEGWTDGVFKHFVDPRVAVVAPLLLDVAEPTHTVDAALSYGVGGVRRVTARFTADVHGAGVTPILAASLKAVFYNRLTLSTAGMLSHEVGADLADIDLGLLLRHAGFISLADPRLQVRAQEKPLEQLSVFRRAICAERLFWRNAPLIGWMRSLVAHPVTVATDAVSHFPSPSVLTNLAGRAVGAAMVSSTRRHHHRLADLQNAAPVPVVPEGRKVRIDRAHDSKTAVQSAKESRVS